MLPGGLLAKKQLTKLKIYNGETSTRDSKAKNNEFEKLNKRNIQDNEQANQSSIKAKKIKLDLKTANMQLEEGRDLLQKFG